MRKSSTMIVVGLGFLLVVMGYFYCRIGLSGVVSIQESIGLFTDFPVRVTTIKAQVGKRISINEPILEIDNYEYNKYLNGLKLKISEARSQVTGDSVSIRRMQIDVSTLTKSIDLKKKELNAQTKMLGDFSPLEISSRELELARMESDYNKIQIELERLQDPKQMQIPKSGIAELEKELDHVLKSKEKQHWTGDVLICPIRSGIISSIGASEGQYLGPNSLLATILDTDTIIVKASMRYDDLKNISVGKIVKVYLNNDFIFLRENIDYIYGNILSYSNIATLTNSAAALSDPNVVEVAISIKYIPGVTLPNMKVRVDMNRFDSIDTLFF